MNSTASKFELLGNVNEMSKGETKTIEFISEDILEGFSWVPGKEDSPPPVVETLELPPATAHNTSANTLQTPPPPLLWRTKRGKGYTTSPSFRMMEKALKDKNISEDRVNYIRQTMSGRKKSTIPRELWGPTEKARERLRERFCTDDK